MNRLTEKINLNDDLNEKIRRLEHRLSIFDKPKEKDFNINSYNDGVFLDLMNLNASERNEIILPENENQDKDNYTINMKINLKKNKIGIGNYGMNRNASDDKRKKTLMEISELMHQKPLSKV